MSEPPTKTAQLLALLRSGDAVRAVALAATFRLLPLELRRLIGSARAARLSPSTYRQIGMDPAELHETAHRDLRAHYEHRL